MSTIKTRFETPVLLLIVVLSAALRIYHLGHSIGVHPDERHMIMVAEKLSLADLNPHSFAYGSFVYYLLWLCSRPLGLFSNYYIEYDGLFWVGRVICVTFGLIGIWLTFRVTKLLFNDSTTALFAAALIAFNPFHIELSRFYTVDVILTTLCTAALLSMLRIAQETSERRVSWIHYLACGIFIGLAVASKITALFLLAPLGTAWLVAQIRLHKRPGIRSCALLLLLLVGVAVTFTAVEPYAFIDHASFVKDSNEQTSLVRGLWRAPYTIQFAHTTPYFYHLKQFFFTMGWPVALTVFCGFFLALMRIFRKPRGEDFIALAYLVPAFVLIAGFQVKFPRYLLALYPVLFSYAALVLKTAFFLKKEEQSESSARRSHHDIFTSTTKVVCTTQATQLLNAMFNYRNQLRKLPLSLYYSAAAVLTALSVALSSQTNSIDLVLCCWIGSILCVLAASEAAPNQTPLLAEATQLPPLSDSKWMLLAVIIGTALILRMWHLTEFPFSLHNDEMTGGLLAREFMKPIPPRLFSAGWYDLPQIQFWAISPFLRIFGNNLFGLRMHSVILGTLSIVCSFLFVRRLWGEFEAFLVATLTTFFHFHLHWSRMGIHYIQAAFLSTALWAVFAHALYSESLFLFSLSGALLALNMLTYSAGTVNVIILPLWIITLVVLRKVSIRRLYRPLAYFAGTFLATLAPMAFFWIRNPATFEERGKNISIFNKDNWDHILSVINTADTWAIAKYQIIKGFQFVFVGGDSSLQYGFSGMLFDAVSLPLFIIGVCLCLWNWKTVGNIFILFLIVSTSILGGVLLVDPPFSPRYVLLAPIVMIIPATAIAFATRLLWRLDQKEISYVLVTLLLLGSAFFNCSYYFYRYPFDQPGSARDQWLRVVMIHPEVQSLVSTDSEQENFNYESFQFIAPTLKTFWQPSDRVTLSAFSEELKIVPKPALVVSTGESCFPSNQSDCECIHREIPKYDVCYYIVRQT